MIFIEFFPISNRYFGVEILKHGISFLECSEDFNVSCSTLDRLHRLLKLDLSTVALCDLSLDELLFLQVDDRSLFLPRLDKLLDLSSRLLVLGSQLLFVSPQLAHTGLDVDNRLVILCDAVLPSTTLRRRCSVVRSRT